jgi:hypothetical protein
MERTTTTITLNRKTVERMQDFGRFGDTYEDVVKRIMDQASKNQEGSKQ